MFLLISTALRADVSPFLHYFLNNWTSWNWNYNYLTSYSIQFSRSVVSDSLRSHGLQNTRLPVHQQLTEFTESHVHWVSDAPNHLILCHPFSSRLQFFPASGSFQMSQFFASGGQSIGVSASASVHSNEYSGLISFRRHWLDLPAVQGTLKSLLQHHSSKASILQHSASFIIQLPHPYMTTGKTTALTRWNFVDKIMSLLFNMLSRLGIAFLPKSKHLLISQLQSPSAVIFGAPKYKVCHCFHCFPIYLPWSDGTGCHDLSFLNVELFFFLILFYFLNFT